MKQINLLPTQYREREAQQRSIILVVLTGMIAVGVVGAGWLVLRPTADLVQAQVARSTRDHEQAAKQEVVETEEERILQDVEKRTLALNGLALQEVNWSRVFTLVEGLVSKEVKLSTYSVTDVPEGISLKLSGESPSNLSFATFLESLKASEDLSKVVVDAFNYDPKSGTVAFTITLSLPEASVLYQTLSVTSSPSPSVGGQTQ